MNFFFFFFFFVFWCCFILRTEMVSVQLTFSVLNHKHTNNKNNQHHHPLLTAFCAHILSVVAFYVTFSRSISFSYRAHCLLSIIQWKEKIIIILIKTNDHYVNLILLLFINIIKYLRSYKKKGERSNVMIETKKENATTTTALTTKVLLLLLLLLL